MTQLIPMTQSEYEIFREQTVVEYAADNVRAGYWAESEAVEKSRKEFERLLPKGMQSENHFLYTVYDGENAVGLIWLRANLDRPAPGGFIFGLRIDEKFRGMGHGKQAMLLIEEKARELGLKSIELHVFGVNTVARNLYEGLGYEITSLNMQKQLRSPSLD
jgi:ribosomal protein S18 acetylase RimI-like enzyme